MPRLRVADSIIDANLKGNVFDHARLLRAMSQAALCSFVPGPWGPGDQELAQEMIWRMRTPLCEQQCFITSHVDGTVAKAGCHCPGAGWHYTSDEDVQKLEGCAPNDVWNDARAIRMHHQKIGGTHTTPIKCDCDDLTLLLAAVAVYESWVQAGCPMQNGLPIDGPQAPAVFTTITQPNGSNTAHAFVESSVPLISDEPILRNADGGLFVTDPAKRWGMRRPPDTFYGEGLVARYRVTLHGLYESI